MKSYIYSAAVFAVLLVTIPAAPLAVNSLSAAGSSKSAVSDSSYAESTKSTSEQKSDDKKEDKDLKKETLRVLDITTGKVEEISSFDYVVGAVCAEMPATFEPEALKAQAVAAYTYAVRQREKAETAPDEELCGAYFSNDSSKYQAYFTENQAKQYYGDSYEEYIEKIQAAVEAVGGEYMTYEDQPIIAAFHSVSTGKTECAENIWGTDIPYLVSVDSEYDTKAPKFTEEYEFTQAEMKEILENSFDGIKLDDDPAKWFSDAKLSDAETVLSIKAWDQDVSGQEIRSVLSLCSAAFEINYDDGIFKITTKGCGHCVGMSQFGANEMAKSGSDYKEILEHYYTGISFEK
ncbi:MAG: stage II sporulation protein D [Porcipelethomonas sp.]